MVFLGRSRELSVLRRKNWRKKGLLTVIYGRRRVGKTALVEEAFKNDLLWKFEGVENANRSTQLALFMKQLEHYSGSVSKLMAADWDDAFRELHTKLIEETKRQPDTRLVVFLDEFQWLCEMDTRLVSLFKYYWDNFFSPLKNCVFVLCGSVSSFIVKKVIHSKALYGRINIEIDLKPLSLQESSEILASSLMHPQMLDIQMIFGGVPQYLLELDPEMSLAQNLEETAFRPTGFFFREFDRLFISHFARHAIYERLLKELASGTKTLPILASAIGQKVGGTLSDRLKDLELAGFIKRETPVGGNPKGKLLKFSLDDEYLHFYFTFILPYTRAILENTFFFQDLINSQLYKQWLGNSFERLCRKNAASIADKLRFSGINYQAGPWFSRQTISQAGAQVDLLFLRADKVLTICEMKHVTRLQLKTLEKDFERKEQILLTAFPDHAVQRVLILGKTLSNMNQAKRFCHHVFDAQSLFFES